MAASKSNEQKPAPHSHGHPPLTFGERLIAGGVAGIVECLIMYPLDVVKTLQQLKVGQGANMVTLLVDLIKRERFGVYRGIISPLLMETPKRAIKFTANSTIQPLVADPKTGKVGFGGALISGLGAGVTETFVIVPFELVKIRMQARENVGKYLNTWDAVRKIASQEGIFTFYKGFESTLWRNGVWNTAYFGCIHVLQQALPVEKGNKAKENLRNFTAGFLGGTIATTFNTPFDVVKSRIQNSSSSAAWTLPEVFRVARNEGYKALYKGYVPKVLRLGPGGGILFLVFEYMADKLRARRTASH